MMLHGLPFAPCRLPHPTFLDKPSCTMQTPCPLDSSEFGQREAVTETQVQRRTELPWDPSCRLAEAGSSMKAHPLPKSPVSLGSAEGSLLLPLLDEGEALLPKPRHLTTSFFSELGSHL